MKSASLLKPRTDKNVAQSQEIKNGTMQPPVMPEGGFGANINKNLRNSVQVPLREERKHEDEEEKKAEIPSGIG